MAIAFAVCALLAVGLAALALVRCARDFSHVGFGGPQEIESGVEVFVRGLSPGDTLFVVLGDFGKAPVVLNPWPVPGRENHFTQGQCVQIREAKRVGIAVPAANRTWRVWWFDGDDIDIDGDMPGRTELAIPAGDAGQPHSEADMRRMGFTIPGEPPQPPPPISAGFARMDIGARAVELDRVDAADRHGAIHAAERAREAVVALRDGWPSEWREGDTARLESFDAALRSLRDARPDEIPLARELLSRFLSDWAAGR